MNGVVRTRVGYAGGTTPDPTYRSIGDHSESIQIDFDPEKLTYADLLDVFWSSHRPTSPAWSRQYASALLVHDDEQRRLAEESKARMESRFGQVFTDIAPLDRFSVAEDYHQKYRLRNTGALFREFHLMYPDEAAFRESTAAARVNGYLDGNGTRRELDAEVEAFGLSEQAIGRLRDAFGPRSRF